MAAQWPTAVATDTNLYVAVNELQNNLSGAINNSVTTIGLNSTTSFPTVGLVLIDNEVIKYTGVSGANLTGCTRAFDGTTAASHLSSAVVSFAICADHHNVIKNEIEAIETYLSNNLGTGSQPLATGHRALASNASGKIVETATTDTEIGYVSGATSSLQTQISATVTVANAALPKAGGSMTGDITMDGTHTVKSLPAATAAGQAVRYEQVNGFRILQRSTTFITTSASSSSATYATTNVTQSITPGFTTSKVVVRFMLPVRLTISGSVTGNCIAAVRLKNGSTVLQTWDQAGLYRDSSNGSTTRFIEYPMVFEYTDSPASTSAQTYTVEFASTQNGSVLIDNTATNPSTLILEELG